MQAVRQSSLAVVRQHDSTALNRDSRPRHTVLDGPHGSGPATHPNSRPRSELSALASRSARLSPNALVMRAWRSLIELRIDDALATVAQFEDEIARADALVAPRSSRFAEVLRAVLLVLKSRDGATVRAVLAALEDAGTHVAELPSSSHHATPQNSRLPAELRPYAGSILADRAQLRTRTPPARALPVSESLSPREHSVLRSMSCGFSNKRIAQELQIAPETVKSHVKGIFIKLAVQTRAHAVSTAVALGLL